MTGREWNHDQSLDWHLLEEEGSRHKGVQNLVRDLNTMYREIPALHQLDCDPAGFEWVDTSNVEESVIAFLRKDRDGRSVLIVSNFTPIARHGYRVGVSKDGHWAERLNTDAEVYGGSNVGNLGGVMAEEHSVHGRPYSIALTLPPLGTIVMVHEG